MASTAEVFEHILSQPPASPHPIAYNYLIPNIRGLENLISILDKSKTDAESQPQPQTASHTPPSTPSPTQSEFQSAPNTTTPNSDSDAPSLSPATPNTTEISLFAAATEAFSQANTNCSIAESLDRC